MFLDNYRSELTPHTTTQAGIFNLLRINRLKGLQWGGGDRESLRAGV